MTQVSVSRKACTHCILHHFMRKRPDCCNLKEEHVPDILNVWMLWPLPSGTTYCQAVVPLLQSPALGKTASGKELQDQQAALPFQSGSDLLNISAAERAYEHGRAAVSPCTQEYCRSCWA